MEPFKEKILYFDTNALYSLNFGELAILLYACKEGQLKLYMSHWVVWERGRQYFQQVLEKKFTDTLLFQTAMAEPHTKYRLVFGVFNWFKKALIDHKVIIIDHTELILEAARELIKEKSGYFSENNQNDFRDAMILCSALNSIKPADSVIICEEGKLGKEFRQRGYEVQDNAKEYFKEVFNTSLKRQFDTPNIFQLLQELPNIDASFAKALQLVDVNYAVSPLALSRGELVELQTNNDKLSEKLVVMSQLDSAIRIRIIGYVQWFLPITKEELFSLLTQQDYSPLLVSNNMERLCIEQILTDTGNHLIPNQENAEAEALCEQGMASVMDEILQLMDLG